MKTTTPICSLMLMRGGFLLLLITVVVVSGCGAKNSPAQKPTPAPTSAAKPTSALTPAPTTVPTAPTLSGSSIAIPSGGSLVVPEGALPKGARISVLPTVRPVLPDDVKPLGIALAVSADVQPTQPVTLRLPIPAGAADPANLAIIRTEADGATTFLMTEVDGQELVASTPGFSTFSIGEVPPETKVTLAGLSDLFPGERQMFYPQLPRHDEVLWGVWSVTGPFTLVHEGATAAVVQAGDTEGFGYLTYRCQDHEHGRRWFGSRLLANRAESAGFKVSAITHTPMVHTGDAVRFTGSAYGAFSGPLTWTWDFGNGTQGEQIAHNSTDRHLELPLTQYELPQGRDYHLYDLKITARDAQGRKAFALGRVRVTKRPFRVILEGPQILPWKDGGVSAAYKATAYGGEPRIQYTWRLLAGKPSIVPYGEAAEQVFTFPEPGDYRLEIVAADEAMKEAAAVLPIRVQDGEALSTRLLDLPAAAKPGATFTVNTQIRGGVLVVSGKKSGYALHVEWGDDTRMPPSVDVGLDRTPYQGTSLPLSHSYSKPRTYTVRVWAYDATGNMASDSRQITVSDAAPTASPAVPKTNTPPVAEDISTSTNAGAAVSITLKGNDPDGDRLTYTFTRPANGSLTGTAPFLTYTPKAGFSGTDTFTYRVRDGEADSQTAAVAISVRGLQWVRVGEPLLNATDPKAPLAYYGGGATPGYFIEPRFTGKFEIYRLSEALIAKDHREVDGGKEFWNVSYESRFGAPPEVLSPGQVVTLTVKLSASGSVTEGVPPGIAFQFGADKAHRNIIQPSQPLGYNPWSAQHAGVDSGSWTLTVPQGRPGDTFQVWAGWWNCAMCNVTWTYRYGDK